MCRRYPVLCVILYNYGFPALYSPTENRVSFFIVIFNTTRAWRGGRGTYLSSPRVSYIATHRVCRV